MKNLIPVILILILVALMTYSVFRDGRSKCYQVIKVWESVMNNRNSQFEVIPEYGHEIWTEERTHIDCSDA